MNTAQVKQHAELIIEQFSKQATPFGQVPGHLQSILLLLEIADVKNSDTVLDLACGPGIVACEFAKIAKHVTGLDVTPAMLAEAKHRQDNNAQENLTWIEGDAGALPFPEESFSVVITRYSFHHLLDPETTLAEMHRVCKPGGRLVVADVIMQAERSAAFDRLEKLRDPSHHHALTEEEFVDLLNRSGLKNIRYIDYGVDIGLEELLQASFPNPNDVSLIRQLIINDIGINALGINARNENGAIRYNLPIRVYAADCV
ncbi:methyltransferase domain-containing protein [Methylomonas sp. AM2-LC]|uniref:class I SAM-dependent methyltransferase n=1 Tax=Methylomonas sp. AM2-LC TaxID=3153301 RepID=UPI0032670735